MSRSRSLLLLLAVCLVVGCQTTRPGAMTDRVETLEERVERLQARNDSLSRAAYLRNPLLNSTLWTQTAVEYQGTARQAFVLAEAMMRRALDDSTWSAALPQVKAGPDSYETKPPAVVLDVDETVLDNSAYEARLILDDDTYAPNTWKSWVREERARAVPGARAFTQAAAKNGVQVIYLTNRDADVEASTRENLQALGFPVEDAPDAVLTQREREGWEPKAARRAWVADRYRILLLIGDNFGDFAPDVETSVADRRRRGQSYRKFWGTRWIVLPNPQYGSWEGALFNFDYGLPYLRRLEVKHERLRPRRPE